MVCENDPLSLNNFNIMLKSKFSVKAELCTNGPEALAKFIENRNKVCCDLRYKLIIIDLDLPEDTSWTTIEQINEHQR